MSTVNVKLGSNIINGVDTVKLQDATTPATYHDFTLGGGATPTFRVVNYFTNIESDGIFTTLQHNGVMLPVFPYCYYSDFDESNPYDTATGLMIPNSQATVYTWPMTDITLGEVQASYCLAEKIFYTIVRGAHSDVRDIATTLSTYGNVKVFVIDAELYAQSEHSLVLDYTTTFTGEESFILDTITLTTDQLETFLYKENNEFDYDHISGRLMELPWSPLYANKYLMFGTNLLSFGS